MCAQFSGQPGEIPRFNGLVDQSDGTSLPAGVAQVCQNSTWSLTDCRTRDGNNKTLALLDKSPVSGLIGLVYQPETATDVGFQQTLAFQLSGRLQYERPVFQPNPIVPVLFTPPVNSHMIPAQTYNKGWLAFSDLNLPTSQMACWDPKALNLDPYGMKPFGWVWLNKTQVLVGEVATPTAPGGNGHTYRCIIAGTTGASEPIWPTTEGTTVVDGTATWQELTAVLANRLPIPAAPVIAATTGGTFSAGQDVYILITLYNNMGETLPSAASVVSNTAANAAVTVNIPSLASFPGWLAQLTTYKAQGVRVYEANVAHGALAPPTSSYQLVGSYNLGTVQTVLHPATSGVFPPAMNSARITPGQLPTPDIAPDVDRVSSGGTFAAGRDVYVLMTYVNGNGETPAGPVSSIIDTEANDGVQVTISAVDGYPQIAMVGIYEADVATGLTQPDTTEFALVGYYPIGASPTIANTAAGPPPPTANTTGPAGNIAADTPNGGINNTQGYRYAAIMFENRNFSVSGFTQNSVIKYIVDEDGWELAIFNVATGPGNIIARLIAFAVADGTQAGDFWWLGNINPQVPSQNFVYPQQILDDGIEQSATCFYDNVTTSGTFNFTDEYLMAGNAVTDRLDIIWPAPCVRIDYHPSIDRMVQTRIPGNMGGCRISNAAAPEDYYGDTCDVTVGGPESAWGTLEWRNQVWLLRERSGGVISPANQDASSWAYNERFSKVGPCGPRAFDSDDDFFFFVHRSGAYRFEATQPECVSKEIPYFWQTINWDAAETICVHIEREEHEVHVLVPIGNSTVPNQKITWNYNEGWENPIHYGVMSSKEVAMDSARKISIDDVSAFVVTRLERSLPPPPEYPYGSDGVPLTSSSFYTSQVVFGSSGSDGLVNAKTPGVFQDNDSGIDWRYRTVCPQEAMALSRIEGFQLNARGNGTITWQLIAGRKSEDGQKMPGVQFYDKREFQLTVDQSQMIARRYKPRINERWSIEFTNGAQKGCWASLKSAQIFTIPLFSGRASSSQQGAK